MNLKHTWHELSAKGDEKAQYVYTYIIELVEMLPKMVFKKRSKEKRSSKKGRSAQNGPLLSPERADENSEDHVYTHCCCFQFLFKNSRMVY